MRSQERSGEPARRGSPTSPILSLSILNHQWRNARKSLSLILKKLRTPRHRAGVVRGVLGIGTHRRLAPLPSVRIGNDLNAENTGLGVAGFARIQRLVPAESWRIQLRRATSPWLPARPPLRSSRPRGPRPGALGFARPQLLSHPGIR